MDNFSDIIKSFGKMQDNMLKQKFKGLIKTSFLISTMYKIINKLEDTNCLHICFPNINISTLNIFMPENLHFEICKYVTAEHISNMYLETEAAKGMMQSDEKYIKGLVDTVVKLLKLRKYENSIKDQETLISYNPFHHSTHVVTNYLIREISLKYNEVRINNENEYVYLHMIIQLSQNIKSVLLLMEACCLGQSIALLRTLIENYMIFLVCLKDKKILDEFYIFSNYQSQYQLKSEDVDEFKEKFERAKLKNKHILLSDYRKYGWLDKHQCYAKGHNYKYKFYELYNLINISDEWVKCFQEAYKHCCQFTHASYFNEQINSDAAPMWIMEKVLHITEGIIHYASIIMNQKFIHNEVNLEIFYNEIMRKFQVNYKKCVQQSFLKTRT